MKVWDYYIIVPSVRFASLLFTDQLKFKEIFVWALSYYCYATGWHVKLLIYFPKITNSEVRATPAQINMVPCYYLR